MQGPDRDIISKLMSLPKNSRDDLFEFLGVKESSPEEMATAQRMLMASIALKRKQIMARPN
jgi:hypothetical protein